MPARHPMPCSRPRPAFPAFSKFGAAGCVMLLLLVALASAPAAEPGVVQTLDGTWRWSFLMPDGTRTEPRAKIKQEGATLTGTSIVKSGQDAPIVGGTVNGNAVAWTVVREHDGRKVTTRYQGVVTGEIIRGSIESDWAGELKRYDWEAHRVPTTPEGTWRWGIGVGRLARRGAPVQPPPRGGRESRATFKVTGETVTGKLTLAGRELEILHGKFVRGELSFEVLRERDGEKFFTRFRGKLQGETIRGESLSDLGRDSRPRPWEAIRVEE